MVLHKSELSEFSRFLRQEFSAKPMIRSGEDGELLRAVIGCQLLMVVELDGSSADVWCSDESWLAEIWAQWKAFSELVS